MGPEQQNTLTSVSVTVAKAIATRLLFGMAAVVVSFVVGYHYLVDRTLVPLTQRIESLERSMETQLTSINTNVNQNTALIGGVSGKVEIFADNTTTVHDLSNRFVSMNGDVASISGTVSRIEQEIHSELKPQLAWFAQEQMDITTRIIGLEERLSEDASLIQPRQRKQYEETFDFKELKRWEIALIPADPAQRLDPVVVISPKGQRELVGLAPFNLERFLSDAQLNGCDTKNLTADDYTRLQRMGEWFEGLDNVITSLTGRIDVEAFDKRLSMITDVPETDVVGRGSRLACTYLRLASDYIPSNPGGSVRVYPALNWHYTRVMNDFGFVRDAEVFELVDGRSRLVGKTRESVLLELRERTSSSTGAVDSPSAITLVHPVVESSVLQVELGSISDFARRFPAVELTLTDAETTQIELPLVLAEELTRQLSFLQPIQNLSAIRSVKVASLSEPLKSEILEHCGSSSGANLRISFITGRLLMGIPTAVTQRENLVCTEVTNFTSVLGKDLPEFFEAMESSGNPVGNSGFKSDFTYLDLGLGFDAGGSVSVVDNEVILDVGGSLEAKFFDSLANLEFDLRLQGGCTLQPMPSDNSNSAVSFFTAC